MRFAFCPGPAVSPETAATIAESASGPDGRAVWETQIAADEIFVWWLPDGSRILGYTQSEEENCGN
jgi:hypothetical protein